MPSGSGYYRVVAVAKHGVFEHIYKRGAPAESWLCSYGRNRNAAFVIRYFPSKKGWRILDVRAVQTITLNTRHRRIIYRGQVRGSKYYPHLDAAIMVAMHKLGQQPELGLT